MQSYVKHKNNTQFRHSLCINSYLSSKFITILQYFHSDNEHCFQILVTLELLLKLNGISLFCEEQCSPKRNFTQLYFQ